MIVYFADAAISSSKSNYVLSTNHLGNKMFQMLPFQNWKEQNSKKYINFVMLNRIISQLKIRCISRFSIMTIFPMNLSDPIIRNDIKRVIRFHTYILEIRNFSIPNGLKCFVSLWDVASWKLLPNTFEKKLNSLWKSDTVLKRISQSCRIAMAHA